MNFIKTQKLLSQQAGQTEIPLESVLELMRTYLTELRYHTNTPVDRCPIGNMPQMVASLAAVSNDILFVYRTNEKDIHAAENRFTQALAKAQNACGQYHSRIQELDAQIQQEEATREQLTQLQEQESGRSAALTQLRQETADLQAQIDTLRATDPETEAGRLKALLETQNAQLAQLKEEYAAMQQEHSINQVKLKSENANLARLQGEVDADMAKLAEIDQVIQDQVNVRAELGVKMQQQNQESWNLKEDYGNALAASEKLQKEIERFQALVNIQNEENLRLASLLEEKKARLKELEDKNARGQAMAQELKARQAVLEAEQTALEAERASVEKQIATLDQSIQSLTAAIETHCGQRIALDERVKQLQEEFGEVLRLHQERDEKVLTLEEALLSQKQVIATVQAEIDTRNTELSGLTLTHQEKAGQLALLNADIQKLESELQQIQEEASLRRTQIAAAEESLNAEKTEFDNLMEQLVAVGVSLEAQKTDNENFRTIQLNPAKDKLAGLVMEARKDRDQLDEIKTSIKHLEDSRATLAQEIAMLMLKQKGTQTALDTAQVEYNQIQMIVAGLEEQLRVKGAESAALLEREKELRELLDEKNVARITTELENAIARLKDDIRRAEQTEKDLAEKQQQLEALQQQYNIVAAELETCTVQHNDLLSRYENTSRELDRITCEENRQRCKVLHNQLLTMQAMTEQLTSHAVQPCGEGFNLPDYLNDSLYQAEHTVASMRNVIREYTALRQNALESSE